MCIVCSENALFINKRIAISVTAKKRLVPQNNLGTSLKNRSSLYSCYYEFKANTLGGGGGGGVSFDILSVYPKVGVGL